MADGERGKGGRRSWGLLGRLSRAPAGAADLGTPGWAGSERARHLGMFWLAAVLLVGWAAVVLALGPTHIVARLGARNGYLVAFLVACLGGISSLTGASFLATVAAFAAGGLSPWKLGLAAGLGATVSDGVFYYAGMAGQRVAPRWLRPKLEALSRWITRRPRWLVPVLVLLYTGATPLPSDVLLGSLGLARVPFRRVLPALLLGNCTFLTWFGYVAAAGGRRLW